MRNFWLYALLFTFASGLNYEPASAQPAGSEVQGNTVAMAREAYFEGRYEEARSIAYDLAKGGDAEARLLMAQMLREGKARSPDYVLALNWVRLAADAGDALAQVDMGISYRNGRGVTKNFTEAAKWFKRAALKGHPVAQDQLAWLHVNGEGVPKNYLIAYAWFSIAVAQGFNQSQEAMELMEKALPKSQISIAQRMAKDCFQSNYTSCHW